MKYTKKKGDGYAIQTKIIAENGTIFSYVVPRSMISVPIRVCLAVCLPSSASRRRREAVRLKSTSLLSSVVSGGVQIFPYRVLSIPMTETCSGTAIFRQDEL